MKNICQTTKIYNEIRNCKWKNKWKKQCRHIVTKDLQRYLNYSSIYSLISSYLLFGKHATAVAEAVASLGKQVIELITYVRWINGSTLEFLRTLGDSSFPKQLLTLVATWADKISQNLYHIDLILFIHIILFCSYIP